MYYDHERTELPILELFKAIEELQYIDELDSITNKLRQKLLKLFIKLPVKELKDGSFGRCYQGLAYYPNGLVKPIDDGPRSIFLDEYPEPAYEKTAQLVEEPVKEQNQQFVNKNKRNKTQSLIWFYTNVGRNLQVQILSSQDRKITNFLGYIMPIHQTIVQFDKLLSMPKETQDVFWANSPSLENKVSSALRTIYDTIFAFTGYDSPRVNRFYNLFAIEAVMKEYLLINTKEAKFSYRDRDRIDKLVKLLVADPQQYLIDSSLIEEDFATIQNVVTPYGHSYKDYKFEFYTFMTHAYPKILKLAEEHEHLKMLFEKLTILPPPSKETIKERRNRRQQLAETSSDLLDAEVIDAA